MSRMRILLCVLAVATLAACTEPRGHNWYQARCAERYELQPGTAPFDACVDRERRIVEETQARADRSRGSL